MQNCIDILQPIDYQRNNFYSTMNGRQLREYRAIKGISQAELSRQSGLSQPTISRLENTDDEIDSYAINSVLSKIFSDEEKRGNNSIMNNLVAEPTRAYNKKDTNALLIGRVPGPEEDTDMAPLGDNKFAITVPLIPFKAWAGYVDNFGDMEYMESLPKHSVTVTGPTRGRYFAFVVDGDSMENYSTEELAKKSIPRGTIVTGREIQKHHWETKLHLHRFQNYVIVLQTGIIVKEIIEHNIKEGYIICHSLNTAPEYADFKLMLDDCVQILNIVRREFPE